MTVRRRLMLIIVFIAILTMGVAAGDLRAADTLAFKVATVNIQKVLTGSSAGNEAKKVLEAKMVEYQANIQKEQEDLDGQRAEIEKKSSVWSAEIRQDKERDYQKKLRELQLKSEDAQFELQQLEKKVMGPIIKDLQQVITSLGEKNGFSIIFDSRAGVLYSADTLDISDMVIKELDTRAVKNSAK